MGCNCGKPKCNGQCDSPAVVQINNPAEYITFHRVDVPAQLGDDTQYPPLIGKYKNVLLHYEANNASYLYSSDGIPTKLTDTSVIPEVKDKPYASLRRLGSYTYEITFDKLPDYKPSEINASGCSSFVKDGKLYRNFDWHYDEAPTFVVKAKGFTGIANGDKLVDSKLNDELLAQLPYRIVDGYNDNGIMMSTHVLYNDWGWDGCGSKSNPLQMLPYLVLNKVKSMATIANDLASVISNLSGLKSEYLLQLVITDGTTTYALMPPASASGNYVLTDISANPKLTNFRWVSNETVERGAAYMQNRPTGVERWNEMSEDMKELRFTKAYESNARLSEFIGINGTTKSASDSTLQSIYNTAHSKYLNRTRNGELWQTVHSVVYSKHGMEHLYTQENWDVDYIAETNERLATVEENVTTLNADVNKLQNNSNGIVGIQAVGSDHYIFYSPDCINFSFVHKLPAGVGNDASALYEINGVFYLMGNNKYWYTTDFVTWIDGGRIKDNYEYQRIWGATLYYDEDNELVYIYSSYQYNNDTHASEFGGTTYYFKIGYQTATINDDGSFTISQTIHDLIYQVGESYIDSYVAKDPYLGYIIAYKNEFTAKVKVAIMNSLTSVSTTEATCIGYGIEAPQLLPDEKGTICFVDGYSNTNSAKTGITNLPNIRGNVYRVSNSGTLYQEKYTGLTPLKMPVSYHHMGIMRCSNKALYLIEQLGVKPTLNSTCSDFKLVDGLQTVSLSSVSDPTLINFPNIQYLIPATAKTVTIKPEYIGIPFRIYAFKGATITWSSDSNIQGACKNKTYTVSHDQLIEFYPSTNDMITGTWVPIDR